jgi:hypothetical protein
VGIKKERSTEIMALDRKDKKKREVVKRERSTQRGGGTEQER